MVDVQCLSDRELHKRLERLGFSAGPILPSTRKTYEKKLVQLLVSPLCEQPVIKRPKNLHGSEHSDGSKGMLQDQIQEWRMGVSPKRTAARGTRAWRAASHGA
ncbi:LEM domain-containing protein 1 [Lemmus lemmus]